MKWVAVLIISVIYPALAYETFTHNEISNDAINISNLAQDPEILISLGLVFDAGVNEDYFPGFVPVDPDGSDPNDIIFLEKTSIVRILTGGSVLEDADQRSVNHFFDPQNGDVGGSGGIASPDWSLESIKSPVTGEEISVTLGNQQFSYKDAQQYFYKALTLPDEQERRINFGMMFRSLGHVIHHLQDMAQPQHVRNDDHCDATTDFPGVALFCFFVGKHNPSYYENYTNVWISDYQVVPADIPLFETPRDYWINKDANGIAEYTSLNFVSAGTNYQANDNGFLSSYPLYPHPVPLSEVISASLTDLLGADTVMLEEEKQSVLERLQCDIYECILDFIQNEILNNETIVEASINTRSSTISIFDAELQSRNLILANNEKPTLSYKRIVSLNRFNFEAAYPHLLSWAVAYSAGLINHFFRGQMEVTDVGWADISKLIVTIKNNSLNNSYFNKGDFEIYYDSSSGARLNVKLENNLGSMLPLVSGQEISLVFNNPGARNENLDKPYSVIFNALEGEIGSGPGISVSRFEHPQTGSVLQVFKLAGDCPGYPYLTRVSFDKQPENKGMIIIKGVTTGASLDFRYIPPNESIVIDNSQYTHGIDSQSGKYIYEVTNRLPILDLNPCASPYLGPWQQGESVIAISPRFNNE